MDDLEHFSYVLPGELAGLAYPTPRALEELRDLGFHSLVSLSRRAPSRHAGALIHLHCPLADFTRLPPLDLHRAVVFLERAPAPIAVHGEGGVGRTGVVLACRLVALGRSAAEAIAEVRKARPGSIDDEELEASVDDYARFRQDRRATGAAPSNLAPASALDRFAHGAAQPGFDGDDPADVALESWLGFMSRQNMREVVCLLDGAELASWGASLLDHYRREFLRVTHVPMKDATTASRDAVATALEALQLAEEAGVPAVVHCGAGAGRTGLVLAAWLRARHGLGAREAVARVRAHAAHYGATRDPLESGKRALSLLEGIPPGSIVPEQPPPSSVLERARYR